MLFSLTVLITLEEGVSIILLTEEETEARDNSDHFFKPGQQGNVRTVAPTRVRLLTCQPPSGVACVPWGRRGWTANGKESSGSPCELVVRCSDLRLPSLSWARCRGPLGKADLVWAEDQAPRARSTPGERPCGGNRLLFQVA